VNKYVEWPVALLLRAQEVAATGPWRTIAGLRRNSSWPVANTTNGAPVATTSEGNSSWIISWDIRPIDTVPVQTIGAGLSAGGSFGASALAIGTLVCEIGVVTIWYARWAGPDTIHKCRSSAKAGFIRGRDGSWGRSFLAIIIKSAAASPWWTLLSLSRNSIWPVAHTTCKELGWIA